MDYCGTRKKKYVCCKMEMIDEIKYYQKMTFPEKG